MGDFAARLDVLRWMLSNIAPDASGANSAATAPVACPDDRELVRRLQARDRKAIADFISDHADAVYAYVRFRLAPRGDSADDIVQEVFLTAWQKLGSYRAASPLRSWLLGIARHKVEDVYRERLREPVSLSDDEQCGDVPESFNLLDAEIDRKRLRDRTAAVLNALPEAYAAVLLWRYWDHRSTAEIAALTGRTEKAIERLLSRARISFRARWEDGRH